MKKKLKLPNISLLAIAHKKDVDQTQISMKISSENIDFGTIKLLTSAQPKIKYPDIAVKIRGLVAITTSCFLVKRPQINDDIIKLI